MSTPKRIVLILALIVVACIDILIYWNAHLYYRAKEIKDNEKKIEVLEEANRFYPGNDLVFYELGKAYNDLGSQNLTDRAKSEFYLQESINNFRLSIRFNPASYYSHYLLAEALHLISYISPSSDLKPYEEYKKVALLLGHNHRIFYDVGKILFSRWSELSEEDRDFTVKILRRIARERNEEKLQTIMQIWDMNVKDYEVMETILPEYAEIYRMYAQFLGEKSLSLAERHKILARAEYLEFEKAKNECYSGENEFLYFRIKNAFNDFKSCLSRLEKINFYQDLVQLNLIDLSEFNNLLKSAYLNRAKCRLEEGEELKEVQSDLQKYLALENKMSAVNELDSYLKNRDLISEKLEDSFDDLAILSFQVLLYFKQNRYRDILRMSRLLQQSFVVVPEEKREEYVKILQMLGDSYQKNDYFYDAGKFYQKALEIEPENLESLLRIRENFEKLNEDVKIRRINEQIEKILFLREIIPKDPLINKGRRFVHSRILDGREVKLDLHFKKSRKGIIPLITVVFNGSVIWEDYLKDEVLSIPLVSKLGTNRIQIIAVNRAVELVRFKWKEN